MRPYTHRVEMTNGMDSTWDSNEDSFSGVGTKL